MKQSGDDFIFDPRRPRPEPARANAEFVFDPRRGAAERERLARPEEPQGGLVPTWADTTLWNFEQCAYRVKLQKVDKIEQAESQAAQRGSAIHDDAERFIRGELAELPETLASMRPELERYRAAHEQGRVWVEQLWGFDLEWRPCDPFAPEVWARVKLDVCEQEDETSFIVADWKSGRKRGNEVKHTSQLMTYAVAVLKRFPEAHYVKAVLHYTDECHSWPKQFTRPELDQILPRLNQRALRLTSAREFPPSPGKMRCRFCPYGKSGDCEFAYKE